VTVTKPTANPPQRREFLMNPFNRMILRPAAFCLGMIILGAAAPAAEPPAMSGAEVAGKLDSMRQDPTSYVRLRMDIKSAGTVLQVQIKERRAKASTELVYQVLWPKERKGESVLLRKSGDRAATGAVLLASGETRTLDASQMKESLLGSDLSYEDVIDNFFAWDQQAIVGTEAVNRTNCQILESKPGKSERSSYASVRTWVDTNRMVPLRIEKYNGSGQLLRRIETTNVAKDGSRHIPANLLVSNPRKNSVTDLDGSKIKHNVVYADREFTAEGLKELTVPKSE
jgi:hypothetical protein